MITGTQIPPDAVYDDGSLIGELGVSRDAIAKARRSGKLQFCRIGNRTLYLGTWIIQWIESEHQHLKPRMGADE